MQNGKNFQTDQSRFNLVDEPWIPVVGKGLSSLREIFSEPDIRTFGGNPIQKIALTKLLLAIGQAACTPKDTDDLNKLDVEIFRNTCIAYLEQWYDRFWLYGKRPFLQMPVIANWIEERKVAELNTVDVREAEEKALPKLLGPGFYPSLPSKNDSIFTQHQAAKNLSDAEKALFIVIVMNFAFGGTQIEKKIFSPVKGKGKPAKPGPSLGPDGYLHTFLQGPTICDTLLLNLLSHENITANPYWKTGLGTAPWEEMPINKECSTALKLKDSYMATLVSISRFMLLREEGVYYVDGITYCNHKEGWREPSMSISDKKKYPDVIRANPARRPWRELTSILAVLGGSSDVKYVCQFIEYGIGRVSKRYQEIGIWSGGLSISNEYGEQFVKGADDFVESELILLSSMINRVWFDHLCNEMKALENIAKQIRKSALQYYDSFEPKSDKKPAKRLAKQITSHVEELFWQMCERRFQDLVNACEETNNLPAIRKSIASIALKAFDTYCPKETVRQIDAWAKSRPNLSKYLSNN